LAELAATYAVAVSANHAFADGNKRAALLSMLVFMRLNGLRLTATNTAAAETLYAVAAGGSGVDALAEWIRANNAPVRP